MSRKPIAYPHDETYTHSCKDGEIFFVFPEDGRFKLDVEAVNCCPGITGGVTVQHPNDRDGPNPEGPYEQHRMEKGDKYSTTFDASKDQQVHIFCNDVISTPNTCVFKYSITKQ